MSQDSIKRVFSSPRWQKNDSDDERLYRYTALPLNGYRFAYLLPGETDDHIRVRLETKILDRENESTFPQWEALSWLWGAYGDFRTIHVNDLPFQITRNLFIALRHLRSTNTARCL